MAYHRALLKYHPDKANNNAPIASTTTAVTGYDDGVILPAATTTRTYTIDEITTAYRTISDPRLRAEYDRSLRLKSEHGQNKGGDAHYRTGLEIIDLEDMLYGDGGGGDDDHVDNNNNNNNAFWYRSCRCGDDRGFLITEQDLEREAEHGEIVVGCRGCSLWVKVLFAVEDEG